MDERMQEALREAADAIAFWFVYAVIAIPVVLYFAALVLVSKEERAKFLAYVNGDDE